MKLHFLVPMLLAVLAVGCASESTNATGRDATPTNSNALTTDARSTADGTSTQFVATGPMPSVGAPYCDAAQHCVYPGTQTLKLTGDWAGDLVQGSAAVTLIPESRFTTAALNLFVGSIAGCGTGTAVVRWWEIGDLTPPTGKGGWEVVPGFGTGDLASLHGHGTGEGGIENGVRRSTQSGRVTCNRR
jgi:hypothetical protein